MGKALKKAKKSRAAKPVSEKPKRTSRAGSRQAKGQNDLFQFRDPKMAKLKPHVDSYISDRASAARTTKRFKATRQALIDAMKSSKLSIYEGDGVVVTLKKREEGLSVQITDDKEGKPAKKRVALSEASVDEPAVEDEDGPGPGDDPLNEDLGDELGDE